jgi:hypothetical protein
MHTVQAVEVQSGGRPDFDLNHYPADKLNPFQIVAGGWTHPAPASPSISNQPRPPAPFPQPNCVFICEIWTSLVYYTVFKDFPLYIFNFTAAQYNLKSKCM